MAQPQHYTPQCISTDLGRSLEGRVDGDLWHVPVVDVLVAVPHAVDQVSLERKHGIIRYMCWKVEEKQVFSAYRKQIRP